MFNKALLMAYAKEVDDTRYTFRFVASKDGSGVNFFPDVSSTYHPDSAFTVKINGKKTDQNYRSLSFVACDEVKIVCKKSFSFPVFLTQGKNYISEVSPLPFMLNQYGCNATVLDYLFRSSADLTSIPSGLFDNNTSVTSFYSSFYYCTGLTSIPSGLFDNNTKVTSFSSTFLGCSNLTSIPSGLFDNNTEVTDFSNTFKGCSNLTSIPSGLFNNNTEVTNFGYTFNGCSSLMSIPEELFANNTEVTDFSSVFYECNELKNIPETLFSNNTKVRSFEYAFDGCSNLTSVPEELFANNTEVTKFVYTFRGCSKLSGRVKIGSPNVTSCKDFCKNTGAMTVIVPAGSTTEATFRAYAETVTNLTVETFEP